MILKPLMLIKNIHPIHDQQMVTNLIVNYLVAKTVENFLGILIKK